MTKPNTDIRWLNNEYGVQIVRLPKGSYYCMRRKEYVKGITRGYVKIWHNDNGHHYVADRALTVANARKRIASLKKRNANSPKEGFSS